VIYNAFNNADADSDSMISLSEFENAMSLLVVSFTTQAAKQTFQAVKDPDTKEDLIDLEGFVIALHMCEPTYNLLWEELKKDEVEQMESSDENSSMEMDDINMNLADKGTLWREKSHVMRVALDEITNINVNDEEKQQMIKKVTKGFMDALRSEDERVIFSTCYTLARLSKAVTEHMRGHVGKLLRVLWELLDETSPLILYCAHQCVTMLIRFIPDSSDNMILKTIVQGTVLKGFDTVQRSCFDSLTVLIERSAKDSVNNEFWVKVKEAITEGVKLTNTDTKTRAFQALMTFEEVQPVQGTKFVESLDANIRAEYTKAKKKS